MNALKNILLENQILKHLKTCQAIGEIELFDAIFKRESTSEYFEFRTVLIGLEDKGRIDVIYDKTETLRIIRIKQTFH